jgi:hypothetical protein
MHKLWGSGFITVKLARPANSSAAERQAMIMIKNKDVSEALRRDVVFVWHAVIAVVFIGFASLAVAAALLDLLSFRN